MRERPIKVVEIDFALQGELMEKVEQVDSGCPSLDQRLLRARVQV